MDRVKRASSPERNQLWCPSGSCQSNRSQPRVSKLANYLLAAEGYAGNAPYHHREAQLMEGGPGRSGPLVVPAGKGRRPPSGCGPILTLAPVSHAAQVRRAGDCRHCECLHQQPSSLPGLRTHYLRARAMAKLARGNVWTSNVQERGLTPGLVRHVYAAPPVARARRVRWLSIALIIASFVSNLYSGRPASRARSCSASSRRPRASLVIG